MRFNETSLTRLLTLVFAACVWLATGPAAADDFELGQKGRINYLIDAMASKNPKPDRSGPSARLSKDYDPQAQAVVYLAIQQLSQEGSTAFDSLVAHFDDERYSYSYHSPNGIMNVTVGAACRSIMAHILLCYEPSLLNVAGQQGGATPWRDYNGEKAKDRSSRSLAKWWDDHRDESLSKLQIRGIDAQLAFQQSVTLEDARPFNPYSRKITKEVFEQRRVENIKMLKELRASLEREQQPRLTKRDDFSLRYMAGLPWPSDPNK
ncbi:MAG TPA: hypothetical protein VGJ26_00810 [Pirellulales bacterium]|jgi:hypothetical protein